MAQEFEPSPFELSETEAISKAAAKIYHERMERLDRDCDGLRRELLQLRSSLDSERGQRIRYETHYEATSAASVLLTIIAGLLASIISIAGKLTVQIPLALVILVCVFIIYKISAFKPK